MKLHGVKSVVAAAVATSLVGFVVATSNDPVTTVEAVPVIANPTPTAYPERELDGASEAERLVAEQAFAVAGPQDISATAGYDPFSAPTPEFEPIQGARALPLPMGGAGLPALRPGGDVDSLGVPAPGTLLSKPVNGRESSQFGMRFHPTLFRWKLHTGLDWAAPCGTPVGAAAAGTVVRVGWAGGNGYQVKIDHGQLGGFHVVTTYNHLKSSAVRVGQQVQALDGIAQVGDNGNSTGCHLHFEVIANGRFTDPKPWLNGTPTVVDLSDVTAFDPAGSTPKASPSPSASPSRSASPTPSPSTSPSPSISPSPSPISSASPSASPSVSPTPSPSATVKPSPVVTPSEKPSATATPTPTPTPSPIPSTSTSPSPSEEPSVKPTPTAEPSESVPSPTPEPTSEKPEPTTPAPAPTTSKSSVEPTTPEPGPSTTNLTPTPEATSS